MTKALIIVDVQNDFVFGSLATDPQEKAVRKMSQYVSEHGHDYDLIVTTQDWHIDPGTHFSDEPDFVSSWPVHCQAETAGARIHPLMEEALNRFSFVQIRKGEYFDAYSGFQGKDLNGTPLAEVLENHYICEIDVIGIATDYCVKETALDGVDNGFTTTVLREYVQGVNPEKSQELLDEGFEKEHINVK